VGVFSGSVSVSKFFVRGTPPRRFQEPFMKALRLRAFRPLEADEEDEARAGWTAPGTPLDLEVEQHKVLVQQYLVLGLRLDRWRIPRALFRAQFDAASAELLARSGKTKLSKKEKDELKFRLTRRLRKKVLPSMRAFDVCWDMNRGVLLFWSRSPRVKEEFCALFEQTFGLRLDEASPFMAAKELLSEKALQTLQGLEPSSFLDA
jgi:recombination associated protein RdgC